MTELNQMQCGICAGCVPQVDGGSGFTNCADAHAAETAGDKMQYTKEQLIERASGEIECAKITLRNGTSDTPHTVEERLELFEIALAALTAPKAEPVFFIEVQGDDWIQAGRIPGSTFDFNNLPDDINNLYAAPFVPPLPQPAFGDGRAEFEAWMLKKWGRERQEYDFILVPTISGQDYGDSYTRCMWKAWSASRAAMLQGGCDAE